MVKKIYDIYIFPTFTELALSEYEKQKGLVILFDYPINFNRRINNGYPIAEHIS